MKIYLDAEFTNFENPQLISIGLVDENNNKFYAEFNDYDKSKCSVFANEIVIPLLGLCKIAIHGDTNYIFSKLNEWLKQYNNIELIIDYTGDWILIQDHIDEIIINKMMILLYSTNDMYMKECRIEYGYPEHHALYDAIVNKYSFEMEK